MQVVGVFLVLLVALLAGCATRPAPVRDAQPTGVQGAALQARGPTHHIHLLSHGWHTGIAVLAEDVFLYLPQLRERFPAHRWLEIGWGDAGFYQAQEITLGLTLQAMFLPTTAVVHVVGFNRAPPVYFEESRHIAHAVGTPQYQDLLAFLAQSFHVDGTGQLEAQNPGIYGDAQFYTGVGHYTIANTCNTWTAKALYSAGMEIPVALSLTASSVMRAAARWQAHQVEPDTPDGAAAHP